MARKPDIKGDRDNWGEVLNEYLGVSLNEDGTIREEAVAGLGVETTVTDAVGEWWVSPIATYQDAPYPRTVFGAISSTGKTLACEYNHGTGKTKRYEVGQASVDDHNVPALWIEYGRRPVMIWTNHGQPGPADEPANRIHVRVGSASGDLGSFVGAPELDNAMLYPASYAQIHKIAHLSSDDADYFWVFVRTGSYIWAIRRMIVNQTTGAVTFISPQISVLESAESLCYVSTADAHTPEGEDQVIRFGIGYNPQRQITDRHSIKYLEINCVTGAITSPNTPALTANVDGTNLPVAEADIEDIVPDVTESQSRRFFYTRPGPDPVAFAYADWELATPEAAQYRVAEYTAPVTGALVPGTGHAAAAYTANLARDANGFTYTIIVKTPASAPSNNLELGRRYQSGAGWYFRLMQTKALRYEFYATNGSQAKTTTATIPFEWGDVLGLRLAIDTTTDTVKREYTLNPFDESPTWTELDETITDGFGTIIDSGQPLVVPAVMSGLSGLAEVYSVSMLDTSGDPIAAVDFTADWDAADATYTDAQGNDWSLVGNAAITTTTGGTETHELGPSGRKFGHNNDGNYIAGIAFENPSRDRAVLRARTDDTTETVDKLRLSGGAYVAETLVTQATTAGRLVRPIPPVNGGPFATLITNLTKYANAFYDFEGDVRGLS